jgi:ribosomal protein S18 acetylase RimI-like enzyme
MSSKPPDGGGLLGQAPSAPADAEALGVALRPIRAADFAAARAVVDDWFGRPVGLVMHRLFFEELGPSGVWCERDGAPVGFLLGLVSEADPELAYIHFHAVDPAWRRRGVGRLLYRAFCERAAGRGCRRARALAAPTNARSLRFHEALGFVGRFSSQHVGPGQDRVVFEASLPLS